MTLKKQVLSGTKWIAIANIFKQLLQLVSLIVFARLLSVDDFGVFAILMIFVGFLTMFSDMGTSAALIHIKNPSNELLSSVFYFNLIVGVMLFLVLVATSKSISIFFENPQLENLLQITALNFIIISFGVVQKALLEKHLDFKSLSLIESISMFAATAMGIGAAVYGFGVYSLIIQILTNSVLLTLLMWVNSYWRPRWHFSFQEIKNIWRYTANLSAFNFINYFARNADNFLIGKFLNSAALGVYSLAYKIMLYPLQNISHVLIRVLFPAFSKIQDDDEKFRKAYLRVLVYIALVSFPLMATLMAVADVFVPVVFGNKWENLTVILMILVPVGMMQSIVTTVGSIFMAKGRTDIMFRIGSINAIVTVAAFVFGLPFGIEGVAFAYAMANLIMLYPNLHTAWKQIGLKVKDGLREISPIFFISSSMALLVYFFGRFMNMYIENKIIILISMLISAISIYLLFINYFYKNLSCLIHELKNKNVK